MSGVVTQKRVDEPSKPPGYDDPCLRLRDAGGLEVDQSWGQELP